MSITFILACIALGVSAITFIWCVVFAYRLKKLTLGKNGASLEDTVTSLDKNIQALSKNHETALKTIIELQSKTQSSLRLNSLVKFNALPDLGGNQSFALALLDEQKFGYVLTLLVVRERMQFFAKRIEAGSCEQELIPEEQTAIKNALARA